MAGKKRASELLSLFSYLSRGGDYREDGGDTSPNILVGETQR